MHFRMNYVFTSLDMYYETTTEELAINLHGDKESCMKSFYETIAEWKEAHNLIENCVMTSIVQVIEENK